VLIACIRAESIAHRMSESPKNAEKQQRTFRQSRPLRAQKQAVGHDRASLTHCCA